jgi:SAM-dependent methyltransferase
VADSRDWAAAFDQAFVADPGAEGGVGARIWRDVFGDEYPEELSPHSYISRSELERFARELRVGPGDVFADLASGEGGPGLWVSTRTGATLVGVDISTVALESAARRAERMGVADRCRWVEGSFESTGLEDGELDAAMSVDALLFTPDKRAAIREFARVIKPSGRLVFTSFDYAGQPVGRPPQVDDHRPLLEDAGFAVVAYDQTEDWRHRLEATGEGLLESVDELAAESGEDRDELETDLREMNATVDVITRRVLVVAERR